MKTKITVETIVNAVPEKAWFHFINPKSIQNWNHASDDWHCPKAENDLAEGGTFSYTMSSTDGSISFDFNGTFLKIIPTEYLKYKIADGRIVEIQFIQVGENTKVVETFEAENLHSEEMQRAGWQAILDNYKKYTDAN
jgi:uncharacterized protein YndB with AHSA1/START domain